MTKTNVENIYGMATAPTVKPEKTRQVTTKHYTNYKVIVLNDDFNTFQHVAECLMKYIPAMTSDRAWELTNQVHYEGQAIVWVDRKSTRLNSSHVKRSRMPTSA